MRYATNLLLDIKLKLTYLLDINLLLTRILLLK